MSMFVYPRHGMVQEMMNKEQRWTAKFIKKAREEQAEARTQSAIQSSAEETLRRYIDAPFGTITKSLPPRSAGSTRSTGALAIAGEMIADSRACSTKAEGSTAGGD